MQITLNQDQWELLSKIMDDKGLSASETIEVLCKLHLARIERLENGISIDPLSKREEDEAMQLLTEWSEDE